MKKIIILGLGIIALILSVISPVYGAYSFPASINTYANFNNLYSNHWAVMLVKTPLGTYAPNKDLYMYIHSPIPGDLVSSKGSSLKSQVYFYDDNNQNVATIDFNEFSGGDIISGWYKVPASMIPSNATQFQITIMSLSTSLWPGTTLLEFNNMSYYAYTDDLQLTMFFDEAVQQAYNDGFNKGYDGGYSKGYNEGYDEGYFGSLDDLQTQYDLGYNIGYNNGYDEAINKDYSAWDEIKDGFFGVFDILNIELLPNFKIGYVFAFFMIIGVLSFLIGKRRG